MNLFEIEQLLSNVLAQYQRSFSSKVYDDENNDPDLLMNVFGITPEMKRENRQYWGRELGMCWQRLVFEIFRQTRMDFSPPMKFGADEPCDVISGSFAIDTKYRIGSGDSGTLKKFRSYGNMLEQEGYKPILLIIRSDNLQAALAACKSGGWTVLVEKETYDFIQQETGFDIESYLKQNAIGYLINR